MGERAFCKIKIYRRNHFSDMRTKTENIILGDYEEKSVNMILL